jgi:hypothetical protein
MQPYFFPYLGYFGLIERTTRWVVFDTVQYIRHGWINRNRILHPGRGWQYVTVPVARMPRATAIRDVRIGSAFDGGRRILGQLEHYRRRAPHFEAVRDLVADGLAGGEVSLARLNVAALARVCRRLEIPFAPVYFSEMRLELGPIEGPWDWALRIAEALGAEEYVNAPGAVERFDRQRFLDAGIRLTIHDPPPLVYDTPGYTFEPALSILDVLMWNSPQVVREHLAAAR